MILLYFCTALMILTNMVSFVFSSKWSLFTTVQSLTTVKLTVQFSCIVRKLLAHKDLAANSKFAAYSPWQAAVLHLGDFPVRLETQLFVWQIGMICTQLVTNGHDYIRFVVPHKTPRVEAIFALILSQDLVHSPITSAIHFEPAHGIESIEVSVDFIGLLASEHNDLYFTRVDHEVEDDVRLL